MTETLPQPRATVGPSNGHVKSLPQGTLLGPDGKVLRINAYALGSGYPYPWGGTGYANYGASQRNNAMVG